MYLKQNQTTNGNQKICYLENAYHLLVCERSSKPSRLSWYPHRLISVFEHMRAYAYFGVLFPSLQKQQVGQLPGPSAGSFEIVFCWSVTYLFLKMRDTGLQQGAGEPSGLFLYAYQIDFECMTQWGFSNISSILDLLSHSCPNLSP